MHHRLAHLDTGREVVEQDAAGLALQHRYQGAGQGVIAFLDMQGGGQLAFDMDGHRQQLLLIAACHHQRAGTEILLLQHRRSQEGGGVGAEQGGPGLGRAGRRLAGGDLAYPGGGAQLAETLAVSGADAGCQHLARRLARYFGRGGGEKGIEFRARQRDHETGIGAELTGA